MAISWSINKINVIVNVWKIQYNSLVFYEDEF